MEKSEAAHAAWTAKWASTGHDPDLSDALAALKANPKLARQPMPGSGRGSKWLPLHCVLLLGPKYPGW